jgi:hypothetical protein
VFGYGYYVKAWVFVRVTATLLQDDREYFVGCCRKLIDVLLVYCSNLVSFDTILRCFSTPFFVMIDWVLLVVILGLFSQVFFFSVGGSERLPYVIKPRVVRVLVSCHMCGQHMVTFHFLLQKRKKLAKTTPKSLPGGLSQSLQKMVLKNTGGLCRRTLDLSSKPAEHQSTCDSIPQSTLYHLVVV